MNFDQPSRDVRRPIVSLFAGLLIVWNNSVSTIHAQEFPGYDQVSANYDRTVQPLLQAYCLDCHSTESKEGELDLQQFRSLTDVRRNAVVWQKVAEMLDNGEMPPKDAAQPDSNQRAELREWVRRYLDAEALASAGDPGPVVLRRLNNAEYRYTIQDLTGVALDPGREFPADSAAGEGFTNTGSSQVMSPAMVTKYVDAARDVAAHVVLLPDGLRFSEFTTRNDRTNATLQQIRELYRRYSDRGGSDQVNLQGIVFETNDGGRLPLKDYLLATLSEREHLRSGTRTVADVATERNLSPKYLGLLWSALSTDTKGSQLLQSLRKRWQSAGPEDAEALEAEVREWQQALWRFTTVGHIGKKNGPSAWMEPVTPILARQEFRYKFPESTNPAAQSGASPNEDEVVLYLTAGTAGDDGHGDLVLWERPRLVTPGRPDLLLKDIRAVTGRLNARRNQLFSTAAACLTAAAESTVSSGPAEIEVLAARHNVDASALAAWFEYLGISSAGPAQIGTPISRTIVNSSGYDFIKGWVGDDALSVIANSSDQHVRVPGNMKPHSVAVHPSPTIAVVVGWKSVAAASLKIEGAVQHAHPECGNGVTWSVELRRGNTRQRLATGISHGAAVVPVGPLNGISVQPGDAICLVIGPRDGNHSCDLTAVDLTISDGARTWSLAGDVSPDILAANPHADSRGTADVWHFCSEPAGSTSGHVIPANSLLARWQSSGSPEERRQLADQVQALLKDGPADLPEDSADVMLYRQLTSFGGPLLAAALRDVAAEAGTADSSASTKSTFGLDPELFGKHPVVGVVESASLCVQAPEVLEIHLPADLVAGSEFVTTGTLHPTDGIEGTVQLQVATTRPTSIDQLIPATKAITAGTGPWTSNNSGVSFAIPVIAADESASRKRMEQSFDDFRQLFPAALCYTKIVPVDEVVTLTLFYREDDQLRRLMLNDVQTAELDRLWNELHFISQDALTLVDGFQQLMEFATQDADPSVFEPMRQPIMARADAFRKLQTAAQPSHVDALVDFATRAWRRTLTAAEQDRLREMYGSLRNEQLSHDEAIRVTLTRILVAPAFLYRLETPAAGIAAARISDPELATRLSYFLWSSKPDEELLQLAAAGRLQDADVLQQQTHRMLQDERVRRLSSEFVCQWLHIYEFDQLDEKSERHFPMFTSVRGPMYEEAIQFFTDWFHRGGSLIELFDTDHTFLNETLARHYGIPGVTGAEWRRVDDVRKHSRGGILALGATLSKQSGASRTSPILRGNWLSEVILGEKLPKPPKGVPPLPDDEAGETLTVRELVERHTSDEKCAGCHRRIDPYGFALETFDAVGRARTIDLGGQPIETATTVLDGTPLSGFDDLRRYLTVQRREAIVRQFCRKLLGYALGRSVQLSDEPMLKNLQQQLAANGYHIPTAIDAIVASPQFREIRGRDFRTETTE